MLCYLEPSHTAHVPALRQAGGSLCQVQRVGVEAAQVHLEVVRGRRGRALRADHLWKRGFWMKWWWSKGGMMVWLKISRGINYSTDWVWKGRSLIRKCLRKQKLCVWVSNHLIRYIWGALYILPSTIWTNIDKVKKKLSYNYIVILLFSPNSEFTHGLFV